MGFSSIPSIFVDIELAGRSLCTFYHLMSVLVSCVCRAVGVLLLSVLVDDHLALDVWVAWLMVMRLSSVLRFAVLYVVIVLGRKLLVQVRFAFLVASLVVLDHQVFVHLVQVVVFGRRSH